MENHYREIADFYDSFFTPPDLERTAKFVTQFLKKHAPGKKFLELGSGTGLYLIPLKKAGFDVVGLDNSKAMLKVAKKKCEKLSLSIPMILGDMAKFKSKGYDAILCFSSSLCYLKDQEAMEKAIHHYAKALNPGGILWLDLPNQKVEIKDLNPSQVVDSTTFPGGKATLVQQIYVKDNRWVSDWYGFVMDKSGCRTFKHESPEVIYDPKRIMRTLEEVGFEIIDVFGKSYGGTFVADSSYRMVIAAKLSQSKNH